MNPRSFLRDRCVNFELFYESIDSPIIDKLSPLSPIGDSYVINIYND